MMLMQLESDDEVSVVAKSHTLELRVSPTRSIELTPKEAQHLASALRVYGELLELER